MLVVCPHCSAHATSTPEIAAQGIYCPACEKPFRVRPLAPATESHRPPPAPPFVPRTRRSIDAGPSPWVRPGVESEEFAGRATGRTPRASVPSASRPSRDAEPPTGASHLSARPAARVRKPLSLLPIAMRGRIATVSLAAAVAASIYFVFILGEIKSLVASIPADPRQMTRLESDALVARADRLEAQGATVEIVEWSLMGVTAIAFLLWFYRAHQNLGRRSLPRLRFTPGWAVGGFFVPILGFFRPYQVMVEVWKGSAALAAGGDPKSWRSPRETPWIVVWWVTWWASNVLFRLAQPTPGGGAGGGPSLSIYSSAMTVGQIGCIVRLVSAGALAWLVARISKFQGIAGDGVLARAERSGA